MRREPQRATEALSSQWREQGCTDTSTRQLHRRRSHIRFFGLWLKSAVDSERGRASRGR